MKKLVFLIALLGCFSIQASATNYYRTTAGVWSLSYEGANCGCSPDYSNDSVFLYSNISMNSNTTFSGSFVGIYGGATLEWKSNKTFTVTSNSMIYVSSAGVLSFNQAKVTVSSNSQILVDGELNTTKSNDEINNSGLITVNGSFTSTGGLEFKNLASGDFVVNGSTSFTNVDFTNTGDITGTGVITKSGGNFDSENGTVNGVSDPSLSYPVYLGAYPQDGNSSSWVNYTGGGMPATTCSINLQVSSNLTLTSNVSAKRIVVAKGYSITVPNGYTLESCENIINDGTIIVEDGGSLLQSSLTSSNSGTGTYRVKRIVYGGTNHLSFMSSPISACSTSTVSTNPCDIYLWDPQNQYYSFDYPSGYTGNCNGVSVTFSGQYAQAAGDYIMDVARGYVVKQSGDSIKSFDGTVNNGNINYTIYTTSKNNAVGWSGDDWNLVGNPYPSAINLSTFLTDNAASMNGGFYIWDDDGSYYSGYSSADYLVYNGVGSTTSPNSEVSFDGKLASGQGFFIQADDIGAPGGDSYTLNFKNTQRVSGSNSNFFREAETKKSRIWLDLYQNNTSLSTALVGFVNDATLGVDKMYDAHRVSAGNAFEFNSLIDQETFAIQGLPTLFWGESVTVKLQFKVPTAGQYSIHAATIEKALESYEFWLIDNAMHTQVNLSQQPEYIFNVSTGGNNTNRFELLVTNKLSIANAAQTAKDLHLQTTQDTTSSTTSIAAIQKDNELQFNAAFTNGGLYFVSNRVIESLEILNLEGKVIYSQLPNNQESKFAISPADGIYILRYTTTTGEYGTLKLLAVTSR